MKNCKLALNRLLIGVFVKKMVFLGAHYSEIEILHFIQRWALSVFFYFFNNKK